MTGSTSVSVLVPLAGTSPAAAAARENIERYLETTGFTFEVIAAEASTYGASLRKSVAEATGSVVVVVDAALPYPVSAIGDAVAMIDSGATEVVFGTTARNRDHRGPAVLRWLLVPELPDPNLRLKAFSSSAAKLVIPATKLEPESCDLEIAYLVNKYGFRVERLAVEILPDAHLVPSFTPWTLVSALKIRLTDRRMGYRAARRCPVCFSPEVWTFAQVSGNVIRACSRCKCRYLNQFAESDDSLPVRRVLRPHAPVSEVVEEPHSDTARQRTSARRLSVFRKQLTARARILEIGVRDGTFGLTASREFEYVGIDSAPIVARHARGRGLEVYCATLSNFVNTGPAFEGIALFHVFENMADPHDALARIKELLKPGGVLFLTTFDTEGLFYLFTERKQLAQNFRTHLILYSRSALIELLEHSGFEIASIGPDFEYRDHKFLRHWLSNRSNVLAAMARTLLGILPDPLLVSSGAIRIVARRRAGAPLNMRAIRSVEPTHAR
ncbi:MAG TPA: bifunctional glycosyltransferase/class I SAM-dependent methyltransferase [Thermoanaerobaculia bacterium]|nr:bifunctional glycosyltransferase/class I SAM-dependent methyltransferase [Thermoanaerobaculia bacterium]